MVAVFGILSLTAKAVSIHIRFPSQVVTVNPAVRVLASKNSLYVFSISRDTFGTKEGLSSSVVKSKEQLEHPG